MYVGKREFLWGKKGILIYSVEIKTSTAIMEQNPGSS
jgi:hypothetical protein